MPHTILNLSNRTGLYAESHGIVANVSDERSVFKCIDPVYRISGMQRRTRSFTTTTSHPVGNLIGGMENRCASGHALCHSRILLTGAVDVGNSRESGTHHCQSDVVCFVVCCFFCDCHTVRGRPGPPQTHSGASPTYFVPWAVCTFIFDFRRLSRKSRRIKFR
jgi:hypothetical protein